MLNFSFYDFQKESFSTIKLILLRLSLTCLGFGFTIYFTKFFGLVFYGSYFEILKYVQLFTILGLLGYPSLISRTIETKEKHHILKSATKISITLCLIFYLFFLINTININNITLLILGLFLLVFNIFSKFYEAINLSISRPIKASFYNISLIHSLFFIIILSSSLFNYQISKFIFYTFYFLITISFIFFINNKLNLIFIFNTNKLIDKFYNLKNAIKIFAYKANRIALTKFDIIILSFFATPYEIGIYGIASRFPAIADSIYNTISSNIVGRLSKSYIDNNLSNFKLIFFNSCLISFFISIIIIITFVLLFNPLMNLFDIDISLSTKTLFLYILPSSINLIFGQIETFMNVLKREDDLYKSSLISFPLIILSMSISAHYKSIDSLLISLLIGSIILNLLNVYFFRKVYKSYFI